MKNYVYLLLIGGLILLSSCGSESKVRRLKLAHGLPTNHPVHTAIEFLAEKVNEKSAGKMQIDVYPSQLLGDERQCLELLQIGSIGITKVSAGVLENFAPITKVLGLPYVFRSREHHFKVVDGPIGDKLLEAPEKYLLRGLCFYDAGSRSFYTKEKPIMTPEDLDGLKIRVMQSKTATEMVNKMGGSATPISWGELYSSLQQGVVDGAENNPPSFYTSKHYEICKYYSINEHTAVPDVLVISTIIWDQLSEQEKEWLAEAVSESVTYQRKIWAEFEQKALKDMKSKGVEVFYPDKAPFMDKVASMLESFKDDQELFQLIQDIQAVKVEPDTTTQTNETPTEAS